MSSAPLGLVQAGRCWRQSGRSGGWRGDDRKDASRLSALVPQTHKCDSICFMLPGALQWRSLPSLQFSPPPVTSQALLLWKGLHAGFPLSGLNNLSKSFGKTLGPWWHLARQKPQTPGDTDSLVSWVVLLPYKRLNVGWLVPAAVLVSGGGPDGSREGPSTVKGCCVDSLL